MQRENVIYWRGLEEVKVIIANWQDALYSEWAVIFCCRTRLKYEVGGQYFVFQLSNVRYPQKPHTNLNDLHDQILVWNRGQSSINTADRVVRKKSVGRKEEITKCNSNNINKLCNILNYKHKTWRLQCAITNEVYPNSSSFLLGICEQFCSTEIPDCSNFNLTIQIWLVKAYLW